MEINQKIKELYDSLFKKKSAIENNLMDMSNLFYRQAEKIKLKHAQLLYIQIISSTIADGYDFITDLLKNKYFKKSSQINENIYKNIFKWNAFYITAMMLKDGYYNIENKKSIKQEFFIVFKINRKEQKKLLMFFETCTGDYQRFQMEFSKYILNSIARTEKNNTVLLALTGNFFYNSYNRFISDCSDYVFKHKAAA